MHVSFAGAAGPGLFGFLGGNHIDRQIEFSFGKGTLSELR